jgi:sulfate/thiosulfate transport system permease protein
MSVVLATMSARRPARSRPARSESAAVRGLLIGVAVAFLTAFLVLPLVTVFAQAFSRGLWP